MDFRKSINGLAVVHADRTVQLIKDNGCKAGVVLNPATSLSHLDYLMDKIDLILLMSVNPGFGGQSFIPHTLEKLSQVRRMIKQSGRDIRLEIDGGVKINNIREIAEAGAVYLLDHTQLSSSTAKNLYSFSPNKHGSCTS